MSTVRDDFIKCMNACSCTTCKYDYMPRILVICRKLAEDILDEWPVESRSKWISVTDRLPETHMRNDEYDSWEESDYVLALCLSGRMAVLKYCIYKGRTYWSGCELDSEEIMHWMPLPELPKEAEAALSVKRSNDDET